MLKDCEGFLSLLHLKGEGGRKECRFCAIVSDSREFSIALVISSHC